MRSQFIGLLGRAQALLLLAKVVLPIPWVAVFAPLMILGFVGVIFWGFFGAIVKCLK